MFRVTRIYADSNNDSCFEDIVVSLHDNGTFGYLSKEFPVKSMLLREVVPDYDYDFHNAPQKQFIILLNGEIEIETSTGEKRRFRGGDIILVEDTTGKGHRTRNVIPARRRSVVITLP